jgi:hypothetical protein
MDSVGEDAEENISPEDLARMHQIEPESITPTITGLQKRPEREAKAEREKYNCVNFL